MLDFVKDHGAALGAIVAGIFGYGRLSQKVTDQGIDLDTIKDSELMSEKDCLTNQNVCKAMQCLKQSQYKDDTIKLTRLIEHVSTKSDEHYEKMLDRLDKNMNQIVTIVKNGG